MFPTACERVCVCVCVCVSWALFSTVFLRCFLLGQVLAYEQIWKDYRAQKTKHFDLLNTALQRIVHC